MLQDFLHFLIFLMNDETCYLNIKARAEELYEDEVDLELSRQVTKKIVINILLGFYWTDLNSIKSLINEVGILREQNQMDEIISNITILDQKSHRIRIKEEYYKEYDPYIFYKIPSVQQHVTSEFSSKKDINEKVDLVGGKYYTNPSEKLKNIKKNLFLSNLPNFLSLFLKGFTKDTAPLVRPVLKLVLLHLQSTKDALKNSTEEEFESLKKKAIELYGTKEFEEALNNILREEDFKDCKLCIGKINKLIQALSSNDPDKLNIEEDGVEETKENVEDLKKKLAKERMNKMKEQFAKKQTEFAEKNKDIIQDVGASEESSPEKIKKQEEAFFCQFCKEMIDEINEAYGVPIYISFSNNFYDTQKPIVFEEQDFTDPAKSSWWPVISSCNHHYHQKCFDTMLANSLNSSDQNDRRYYTSKNEICCAVCKTLSNNFLPIKNRTKDNSPVSQQEETEFFNRSAKFALVIKSLYDYMIKRTYTKDPLMLTPETLFEKAYNYFIDSFYLQKQESSLKAFIQLYLSVFRNLASIAKVGDLKQASLFNEIGKNINVFGQGMENLLKLQSESFFNLIFFNDVLSKSTLEQDNKKTYIQILKEYLSFKITQSICFEPSANRLKAEDCIAFYLNNQSFKEALYTELVFPIQKIVLAYNIKSFLKYSSDINLELCSILSNPNHSLEYLDMLCQQIDHSLQFEQLLTEAFTEVSKDEFKAKVLNSMLAQKVPQDLAKPKMPKFSPSCIELPDNYAQFNNKYMKRKCSLCNKYSHHLLLTVCLICDEAMCMFSCNLVPSVVNGSNHSRNLNTHCAKYHMGLGVFIEVGFMSKVLVNYPFNMVYHDKSLYIDKYGQAIESILNRSLAPRSPAMDFRKYGIDQEFKKELEDDVLNADMGKDIFRLTLENRAISPGTL